MVLVRLCLSVGLGVLALASPQTTAEPAGDSTRGWTDPESTTPQKVFRQVEKDGQQPERPILRSSSSATSQGDRHRRRRALTQSTRHFHTHRPSLVMQPPSEVLCIQQLDTPRRYDVLGDGSLVLNVSRELVVHGTKNRPEVAKTEAQFGQASGQLTSYFPLRYTGKPPPADVSVSNSTAFFVGNTCEANVDHFLFDTFLPLFASMLAQRRIDMNDLGFVALNRVFYAEDLHAFDRSQGPNGGFCHNPLIFEPLIQALNVPSPPEAFWGRERLWTGAKVPSYWLEQHPVGSESTQTEGSHSKGGDGIVSSGIATDADVNIPQIFGPRSRLLSEQSKRQQQRRRRRRRADTPMQIVSSGIGAPATLASKSSSDPYSPSSTDIQVTPSQQDQDAETHVESAIASAEQDPREDGEKEGEVLIAEPETFPMCFKQAVVVRDGPIPPAQAMDYVAKKSGLTDSMPTSVTIIQRRSTRRILNIDMVVDAVKSLGFSHVQVVSFEGMSVLKQIQIARCSSLLIGTHGAALAWSSALHLDARLVEIRWPGMAPKAYYSCSPRGSADMDKCFSSGACIRECLHGKYGTPGYTMLVPQSATYHSKLTSKIAAKSGPGYAKSMDVTVDVEALRYILDAPHFRSVEHDRGLRSYCGAQNMSNTQNTSAV